MRGFRGLLSYEGGLIQFLEKVGGLILVNVMFVLCCIPVVTIGASLTSFYYSMIKSVRRERGGPVREFFSSMKRILGKGIIFTLEIAAVVAVLAFGAWYAVSRESQQQLFLYIVLLVLFGMVSIYVFPVLSRFTLKHLAMWKLAFIMCFRHFPTTLVIAAGSVLVGYLLIFKLPLPCVLVVPGIWCFVVTFLMERVLLAYMPPPTEDSDEWYYEGNGWRGKKGTKKGVGHESE